MLPAGHAVHVAEPAVVLYVLLPQTGRPTRPARTKTSATANRSARQTHERAHTGAAEADAAARLCIAGNARARRRVRRAEAVAHTRRASAGLRRAERSRQADCNTRPRPNHAWTTCEPGPRRGARFEGSAHTYQSTTRRRRWPCRQGTLVHHQHPRPTQISAVCSKRWAVALFKTSRRTGAGQRSTGSRRREAGAARACGRARRAGAPRRAGRAGRDAHREIVRVGGADCARKHAPPLATR